jgi:hypothetical protein
MTDGWITHRRLCIHFLFFRVGIGLPSGCRIIKPGPYFEEVILSGSSTTFNNQSPNSIETINTQGLSQFLFQILDTSLLMFWMLLFALFKEL